jgi:hypothetical protein
MNASEFAKAYLGEFKTEDWQKDLLENIELLQRYKFGIHVGGQRARKWQTHLMYLRACWEMGMETCTISGDVESIRPRLHVVYDDLIYMPKYPKE